MWVDTYFALCAYTFVGLCGIVMSGRTSRISECMCALNVWIHRLCGSTCLCICEIFSRRTDSQIWTMAFAVKGENVFCEQHFTHTLDGFHQQRNTYSHLSKISWAPMRFIHVHVMQKLGLTTGGWDESLSKFESQMFSNAPVTQCLCLNILFTSRLCGLSLDTEPHNAHISPSVHWLRRRFLIPLIGYSASWTLLRKRMHLWLIISPLE